MPLYHGSFAGESSLPVFSLPPIHMSYVGVCYGVCFLLSGSHVVVMFTNGVSTSGVCNTTTLQSLTALSRGELLATHSVVHQTFHQNSWQRVTKFLCLLYMLERDLLLQVLFHLIMHLTLILVGIKPEYSGVVIGY